MRGYDWPLRFNDSNPMPASHLMNALTNSSLYSCNPFLPCPLISGLHFITRPFIFTYDNKSILPFLGAIFHFCCLANDDFTFLFSTCSARVVGQVSWFEYEPSLLHRSDFVAFLGQVSLLDHFIDNMVHYFFKGFFIDAGKNREERDWIKGAVLSILASVWKA